MSEYKKGDLYRFKSELRQSKGAPTNIFSLVSHFVDDEDKTEKLVLRDSGTLDALIAVSTDMEKVEALFEEKLLSCLTDIGESLRIIAQHSSISVDFEENEVDPTPEPSNEKIRKKNVH